MLESNQSFNGIWGKLEGHLARLYNIDERIEDWLTAELYMSLYTLVYEYCVSMERSSEQIATIQGKEIYEALLVFYDRLLSQLSTQQEMEDPSGYLLHWKRYEEAAPRIEAIFQYLDRFWVERERQEGRSILHIYPMLWRKWDELVLERVERRLLSYSEGCLVAERGAATGNGMFLEANSTCVKIFASYHSLSTVPKGSLLRLASGKVLLEVSPFTGRLLPWYCEVLRRDAGELLGRLRAVNLDDLEIIKTVDRFWELEMSRAKVYLSGTCIPLGNIENRIKDSMKQALLIPLIGIIRVLVEDSISNDENPIETLSLSYGLTAKRKSLIKELIPAVESGFFMRLSSKVPRQNAKPDQLLMLINLLFAMYQEGLKIVANAMENDKSILEAFESAIKNFVSDSTARSSFAPLLGEYLARWIDMLLRDQKDICSTISFIMTMLKYLPDRESFQRWYSRLLAKRLLARQAHFNAEPEETLLRQLASSYGQGYISNQMRMIDDVESSIRISQQFLMKIKRTKLPFELSFQILTSGCWPPIKEDTTIKWDPGLQPCLDSFSQFYHSELQNNRRKLMWSPSLSTAEVMATFSQRTYSFILSAAQMAIIGEIQGGRSRSIIELSTSTSLTPATIQSALQRLLQVHLIVAIHSDSFRLNHDFTSPYSRLNLSVSSTEADQIVLSEAGKENLEDHSFALQAQVVRFLKKRTTCTIDDVQGEIGRGVDELMRILETLREKEYVRIDDNNLTYIP